MGNQSSQESSNNLPSQPIPQQQPQQQQQQFNYQQDLNDGDMYQLPNDLDLPPPPANYSGGHHSPLSQFPSPSSLPLRLPTKGYNKEKDLCAVILTINDGCSYDTLFRCVEQVPPEEDVAISLWELKFRHLEHLAKILKGEGATGQGSPAEVKLLNEIVSDLNKAEPQSVLLNFECCSLFGDRQAPDQHSFMKIIRLFLDRGHNVNTGDFSTKALVTVWDEAILGPNPFVRCGECSHSLTLNFNKKVLEECASSQLQQVAELSEKGEARLSAMGGTCLFSVDHSKSDTTEYTLEVLTIVSKVDGGRDVLSTTCEVDADGIGWKKGCAGHVLLTYSSGGHLVASSGHWIELSNLDTSMEQVAQTMANKYGFDAAQEFRSKYAECSGMEQQQYLQMNAAQCVQSSAPVSYGKMSKKC